MPLHGESQNCTAAFKLRFAPCRSNFCYLSVGALTLWAIFSILQEVPNETKHKYQQNINHQRKKPST